MRLTRRVSTYVAVVMSVLSAVLLFAAATALLSTAFRTDERTALEESSRAMNAIQARLDAIGGNATDWAMWDDTYEFMNGDNPSYVEVNLPAETFTNLDVNVVGFYDRLGRPQKIITVNPVSGKPVSLPGIDDLLLEHPSLNLSRSQEKSFSGVLRLPGDQLLLVGTGPIMPSDRSAPPNGTLVMGRVLDFSAVESIGESTQLDLTMSTAPIAADVPAATSTAS
ncbi:MAG TPA: CHASE4 domain-containing protein, partial [Coriobacteriia bacterium]|nr:CHASE4 domain-containing protein [Coriobacteriia bacterium]